MIRKTFLALLFISTLNVSNAQITKNNWMFGGTVDFNYDDNNTDNAIKSETYRFNLGGRVGYFLIDRLAIGILPNFSSQKNIVGTNTSKVKVIGIGPFARYYFLPSESRMNFLVEPHYSYGRYIGNGDVKFTNSTFGLSAGAVYFVNSVVGFELLVGYKTIKQKGFAGSNTNIFAGIGIQVHLEKEKGSN